MILDFKKQELICRIYQAAFLVDGCLSLLIAYTFFSQNTMLRAAYDSFIGTLFTYILLFSTVFMLILYKKTQLRQSVLYISIYPIIYFFVAQIFVSILMLPKLFAGEVYQNQVEFQQMSKELWISFPGAILSIAIGSIQIALALWSYVDTQNGVQRIKPPAIPITESN